MIPDLSHLGIPLARGERGPYIPYGASLSDAVLDDDAQLPARIVGIPYQSGPDSGFGIIYDVPSTACVQFSRLVPL